MFCFILYMWCMHVFSHPWKSEAHIECLLHSLFYFLRQHLSLNLKVTNSIRLSEQETLGGLPVCFSHCPCFPPPSFFYFSAKDPNSSLHACMVVTFWLGHLSGLCLFFFLSAKKTCPHDTTFFTIYFIATPARECLKCKARAISPR